MKKKPLRKTQPPSRSKSSSTNEAILYVRVSDKDQGANGLQSQESTCREYAERKGYSVIAVFSDDFTGETANREGLKELLAFLQKRKSSTLVIVDHLNRIARSVRTHYAVRDAILKAGGKLESPNRVFKDNPDDDILEIIEAAFANEHRRTNAEQTLRRMRGRCLDGHWCLQLPYGYKYRRDKPKGHGAIIDRDEPVATTVQNALEGYSSGFLTTQADVARFLAADPLFPRHSNGRVPDQVAKNILTNPLYAGYVCVPHWDVSMRPGHHPALISFETFQRIQRRLESNQKGVVRKDNSEDFPLRGFVVCGCCGTKLTAYWAKGGSNGRYAYYHCREKSCEAYSRSIPRAKIEGEFADLLRSIQPTPARFEMIKIGLGKLWDREEARSAERKKNLRAQIRDVDAEIRKLVDRVIGSESETLIAAYEKRISEAEFRKAGLSENLANCDQPRGSFDEMFRTAMEFLANPCKLWLSDGLILKRLAISLVFKGDLEYVRETGFRTPLSSSPFRLFQACKAELSKMARPERFERPTLRFVV